MPHRRIAVALAVTLAGATVSACATTTVAGRGVAPPGVATARTAAAPSTSTPAAGPSTTAPSTAARYVDVTGRGVVRFDRGVPSPQAWAAAPTPGVTIVTPADDVCTLGPAVVSVDGLSGFVTAGHCDPATGDRMQSMDSSPDQRLVPLAAMTDVVDHGPVDSGAIWTDRAPVSSPLLAETWPIAGVLTAAGVAALPVGVPVCALGARSGVVCGPNEGVGDGGLLHYGAHTVRGDSGGPVFVLDAATRTAALVGVHKGGDGVSAAWATLLDPALARLRATAIVDAAGAKEVTGRPGYSSRITPAR